MPPLGLGTTLVTSRIKPLRLGTADAPKFEPETATSRLKYATAWARSFSCSSPHSVLSYQTFFLCVPRCKYYCAVGLPAAPQQFGKAMDCFKHCRGAAVRIHRPIHPRVTM